MPARVQPFVTPLFHALHTFGMFPRTEPTLRFIAGRKGMSSASLRFALPLLTALFGMAGCSEKSPTQTPGSSADQQATDTHAATAAPEGAGTVKLQGAGASFPAPLYTRWFKSFSDSHKGVQIDYQSVGSGSGVKAVIDGTVDFGASDAAMTAEEMGRVANGVQLLPMTAGSIVLTFNVDGVTDLKLSRKAYVGIFSGQIKNWNDPAIAATNPGVKLPKQPINVVVRADSSGTTFVFTKHLSEVSPEFSKSPGVSKMPNWAVGTKSKGNEGVTASVKTTPGSIGYIEYGYAMTQKLPMAQLENKAGKYVAANTASGQAALAGVTFSDDMIGWAPDPAADDAYPIVTYTWLILYKSYKDKSKLDNLREVLDYALGAGQGDAEKLGYIPLPAATVEKVKAALGNVKLAG
jgi:phosphate transport system substrate-binding protein